MSRISSKGQVAIPKTVLDALGLKPGDIVEFEARKGLVVGKPKKLVDAGQAWFWSRQWQRQEREAEKDIRAGRIRERKTSRGGNKKKK